MDDRPALVRLRDAIRESGKSCIEIAREAGVHRTTVHRLAKGLNVNPDLKTVRDVARVCGWTMEELFSGE